VDRLEVQAYQHLSDRTIFVDFEQVPRSFNSTHAFPIGRSAETTLGGIEIAFH